MQKLPSNLNEAQEMDFVNNVLAKQIAGKIRDFNKQSKHIKVGDFYMQVGESKPTKIIPWWKFWVKK